MSRGGELVKQGGPVDVVDEKSELIKVVSVPAGRWLTVKEAAAYLKIHLMTAYEWAGSGKLPSARVGRIVRIDRKALDAELERQSQGVPAVNFQRRPRKW
jgi:excisionase family DNA binding protein